MGRRYEIRDRIRAMDPERDSAEISRLLATFEFPWDVTQALSFALFRTFAVPSVGRLLHDTHEFTERTQKRHDDTVLVLDAVLEHGMDTAEGRAAIRRMNQMHRSYPISNDDMRYVLSTFVVTPVRWNAEFGWRRISTHEISAMTSYYLELGRHMGIKDLPSSYAGFEDLLDSYERDHFAYDEKAKRVADATLELFLTFPPTSWLPRRLGLLMAYSLMGPELCAAFRYPLPPAPVRRTMRGLVTLRGRLLRFFPPRRKPFYARELSYLRSYPGGYLIEHLGTFPDRAAG